MEDFKITYVRYDDRESLAEGIKNIMDSYDMSLDEADGDRYVFEKDRSYYRTFRVGEPSNGWIAVHDDDTEMMDSFCQELSGTLGCFALCLGTYNNVLFYTAYSEGEQADQYMSGFDYYEYELTDELRDFYRGNANTFQDILDDEAIKKMENILEDCRNGSIDSEEAMKSFQILLKIAEKEDFEDEQTLEDRDIDEIKEINPEAIFYVDFKNINAKADDREKIISAIEDYASESGYRRVEEFTDNQGKKGLFKRMLSAVSEFTRLKFYVSQVNNGWITFVGEKETFHGNIADNWDFLDVGEEISHLCSCDVIKLYADSEKWGFDTIRNGEVRYSFSSDTVLDEEPGVELVKGIDLDDVKDILGRDVSDASSVNSAYEEFCSALKIDNCKINIPMDYTEEEFKKDVLDLLPDGEKFIELKFEENK